MESKIIYTITDEAPALATRSWLPVIEAYLATSNVKVETRDISLAARVLAAFPDALGDKAVSDDLAELGELVKEPEANVIKLPNISASVVQLQNTISELQSKGFNVPDYPEEDGDVRQRYAKVLGSAVNPVLREGNSDRRAPNCIKEYAKKNPHRMGAWGSDSKSTVACMSGNDFRNNEQSTTVTKAGNLKIELVQDDGQTKTLKEGIAVLEGEVIDSSFMDAAKLQAFLKEQIQYAKDNDILFSLHMKATMMKVSDPIIFGHCVKVFFADVFEKYGADLEAAGANPNTGLISVLDAVEKLPADKQSEVRAAIDAAIENGPEMAMVNSDKGITNLHIPSDVIIDASMPAMIRDSGGMWNRQGKLQDAVAVIPESSYAGVYQSVIEDCIANGAYDPSTMGTIPNVGLMAKKAQEYGSHDKTFEIPAAGTVKVTDQDGNEVFSHKVNPGDIWRMCQTKDVSIKNWVELAAQRARLTDTPVVFWLNEERPHDAELIKKVNTYLKDVDTDGLEIKIMSPVDATKFSIARIREGKDTISATGNVLRDYLTDLFPILEVGTSAKMLSIVPLMNGGGLFETGAGGSAPKHVEQLTEENHLRWDSLGEFFALAASLEHLGNASNNQQALVLAKTLDEATGKLLDNDKNPSRKVGELDNRGSHFYLAKYWAEELAAQSDDAALAAKFAPVAEKFGGSEDQILGELNGIQGKPADIGGYFLPDDAKSDAIMRPSATFNEIVASV